MNTKSKTPILLIDNNPRDVNQLGEYLNEVGFKYELYHAENLYDGLELLKKTEVELVLLELNLPDSQGFKTISTYFPLIDSTC
mgnify:CR=1 FL=1